MTYEESYQMELKELVNADFKKEVIAFANSDGGEIYVGIDKTGQVVGLDQAEHEMERIGNMIRDGIKPDLTAHTSLELVREEGKSIIKLTVQRGLKRPYHLSDKGMKPGGVYVRHGVSSVPASDEMIRQMIKESDGTVFDKMRCIRQDLTFTYAERVFAERKMTFTDSNKHTLKLIDEDGYFTNAALLLSDQCEHSIKCAVFEGTGKRNFHSRKEFTGSILRQMDDAYAYISLSNHVRSTFEGLLRIDSQDYPEDALREALINAIVHRDYDYSGSILVSIFDDRIEFVSIGGLVKGMTMVDIMGGVSQPRNTVIADVFYRLEFIESYGTGIRRIQESYENCPAQPEIKVAPASFMVMLPNMNEAKALAYNPTLSDKENVLNLLHNRGQVSRKEVEQFLGSSQFPAISALNALVKEGKVVKTGAARATKYALVNDKS